MIKTKHHHRNKVRIARRLRHEEIVRHPGISSISHWPIFDTNPWRVRLMKIGNKVYKTIYRQQVMAQARRDRLAALEKK